MIETVSADVMGLAALVGRTPLLRLRRFEPKAGVEIYAKLESRNPGGSVKDRAALAMIREGERSGALHRDVTLLDATSGNTGIAYAMLGAARGYRVRLCVPANVTRERKQLLHAYGADLVLTDPMDGSDGAIREARRLYEASPAEYLYPDQYSNPANWRAHYDTTGPEIIEQTEARLTHFVAGLGTSGTFVGVGRRLRDWRPSVTLISVQPQSPLHGLEGLKHMASAIVPAIYDPALADRDERVSTEDAYRLVLQLAREEGVLVGPSGGAALAASLRVAHEIERGIIVTVFPDGGDRYLSERFWIGAGGMTGTPDTSGASRETPDDRAPGPRPQAPGPRPPTDQSLSVRMAAVTLDAIRAHGAETYPDECCGALLGPRRGEVVEAFALPNETSGERRRRFLIGPDEYQDAERRATESGQELLGFYHSHPDHPAIPSTFDLDHAWPNLSYIIVSVKNGQPDDLRSWRLKADRSGYDEEAVQRS